MSPKQLISARLSNTALLQLQKLCQESGASQAEIIAKALDRLYQERTSEKELREVFSSELISLAGRVTVIETDETGHVTYRKIKVVTEEDDQTAEIVKL